MYSSRDVVILSTVPIGAMLEQNFIQVKAIREVPCVPQEKKQIKCKIY